jgi:hypothetical protein
MLRSSQHYELRWPILKALVAISIVKPASLAGMRVRTRQGASCGAVSMCDEQTIAKYCAVAGLALCIGSMLFPQNPSGDHGAVFNATAGFLVFAVSVGYLIVKRGSV